MKTLLKSILKNKELVEKISIHLNKSIPYIKKIIKDPDFSKKIVLLDIEYLEVYDAIIMMNNDKIEPKNQSSIL